MISPEATTLMYTFVALCLGALVGLERQVAQEERAGEKDFPGVRTFAFTALAGAQIVDLRTGELRLEIDPSPNRFLPAEDELLAVHLDRSQAFVFPLSNAT